MTNIRTGLYKKANDDEYILFYGAENISKQLEVLVLNNLSYTYVSSYWFDFDYIYIDNCCNVNEVLEKYPEIFL